MYSLRPFYLQASAARADFDFGDAGCNSGENGTIRFFRYTGHDHIYSGTGGGLPFIHRACACNDQHARRCTLYLFYSSNAFVIPQSVGVSEFPNVTGFVTGYSVSPSLPNGMSFNTTTGEISGAPNTLQGATSYTVTASNTGGNTTDQFTIEVIVTPPSNLNYRYAPFVFTDGVAVRTSFGGTLFTTPTVTGFINPGGYSISPSLPSGLIFDMNTGAISGTPSGTSVQTNYTATATGSAPTTTIITIEVRSAPSSCAGVVIAGSCWYFRTSGGSGSTVFACNTICTLFGKSYDSTTATFAGSGAPSGAHCEYVMALLREGFGTQPFNRRSEENGSSFSGWHNSPKLASSWRGFLNPWANIIHQEKPSGNRTSNASTGLPKPRPSHH